MKWIRYRLYTKALDDYRPLLFNAGYPWWCSGTSSEHAVIIAWLPEGEDIYKYWDDATDITTDECDEISFSGRFPEPSWYEAII